jgi:periplasmic divalent cation tolerance protein
MKAGGQSRIVIVTCANAAEARRIARAAVEKRLAACANILGGSVQSVYRWKRRVETARETLMLLKTTAKRLTKLEREVKRLHSYDVPEFVVVPIVAGSREYLGWVAESVKSAGS